MIQISAIVLYSHDGRMRRIPLELGKVNIITGQSKAGKTAVTDIIDYCFGSKTCHVPEGVVRRNVSWFGLILQTVKGQAFVARLVPEGNAKSSESVFVATGVTVEAPAYSQLRQITNLDGLRQLLGSWSGISDYLHEPPAGQTRDPLSPSIRHAVALCLQTQGEIAQREYLFHDTNDNFFKQALKDTLPYFLGAVPEEYVAQRQELKRIRGEIRQIERRIAEAASIRGEGVGRADTLLSEAKAAGLTDLADGAPWAQKIETLRAIQSSPLPTGSSAASEDGEYDRLTSERSELVKEQRALTSTLQRAKNFEGNSKGFSAEAKEHQARLAAVSVFELDAHIHSCPLCQQSLPEESVSPSVGDLRSAQAYIGERSGAVDSATPRIEFAMQEIQEKLAGIEQRISANRERLSAIKKSNQRLQLVSDLDSRRALIVGRISLYVENVPDVPDLAVQERQLIDLKREEERLTTALSADAIQQQLDSRLSNVARYLSEYAKKIDLEYSDSPLRLDVKNLTVVADTLTRAVPMSQMGSGENHVGYHIVAHLALQTWFTKLDRPVPRFLILDQLSQAHFPPDIEQPTEPQPSNSDADHMAVKRLYDLIFDVVESLSGGFQVIITDHPDFNDDPRFQTAVREKWRNGLKLVPQDWPPANG